MAVLKEEKLKIFHVFVYSFEVIVCLRIELNKMGIHTIVVFNKLMEFSEKKQASYCLQRHDHNV